MYNKYLSNSISDCIAIFISFISFYFLTMPVLSAPGSDNLVYVFACGKRHAQSRTEKLANTHTYICTYIHMRIHLQT